MLLQDQRRKSPQASRKCARDGIFARPFFVFKEKGGEDELHLVPLVAGACLQDARKISAAVEGSAGIAITRKGLALRVKAARLAEARLAINGERGTAAGIVENTLY